MEEHGGFTIRNMGFGREEKMRRRHFKPPVDMYEALMGKNAEIRDRHGGNIIRIGRWGRVQGGGRRVPFIVGRLEGPQYDTNWGIPNNYVIGHFEKGGAK